MENRSLIVTPKMVNSEFTVSNGNSIRKIKITADHVGHRLGEFYESKVRARYKVNK